MAAQAKQRLTPEEYFLLEERAEYKSEYRDGEKFALYRRIESLTDSLLVAQDKPRIEHYTRRQDGLWLLSEVNGRDAAVKLDSLKIDLRLASIYAFVDFDQPNSGCRTYHDD